MFAARSKITDLEAQIATLKKKVEDVEVDKEHVETDKNESLEINLEAERVKAATAEEAKQRAEEV
ncbi:hypothetical protein HanHA89_Chr16g0667211 [Helianthus annuus]|nr:hypothetical protein HanHA89_Chr16g0667211 [Helianthus annuus]